MDTTQEDQAPATAPEKPAEKPKRLRFAKTERTLDCILTKEDREERSKESHALTAMIEEKEREQAELKSRAGAVGKEIDRLNGKQRALSKAAHTGQESRTIYVHKEYDHAQVKVYEVRDDTGAELGTPRRPYPEENEAINNILQGDLFEDVEEENDKETTGDQILAATLPEWIQVRAKEIATATQGKPKLLNLAEFIDMVDGLDGEPIVRQRAALAIYQQEHDRLSKPEITEEKSASNQLLPSAVVKSKKAKPAKAAKPPKKKAK